MKSKQKLLNRIQNKCAILSINMHLLEDFSKPRETGFEMIELNYQHIPKTPFEYLDFT